MLIDRLPDGYRQVFRLSMLEKLSHKEIGLILGIAPHSSSSQLLRAKVLLRKYITEYRALSRCGVCPYRRVADMVVVAQLGNKP